MFTSKKLGRCAVFSCPPGSGSHSVLCLSVPLVLLVRPYLALPPLCLTVIIPIIIPSPPELIVIPCPRYYVSPVHAPRSSKPHDDSPAFVLYQKSNAKPHGGTAHTWAWPTVREGVWLSATSVVLSRASAAVQWPPILLFNCKLPFIQFHHSQFSLLWVVCLTTVIWAYDFSMVGL